MIPRERSLVPYKPSIPQTQESLEFYSGLHTTSARIHTRGRYISVWLYGREPIRTPEEFDRIFIDIIRTNAHRILDPTRKYDIDLRQILGSNQKNLKPRKKGLLEIILEKLT